MGIVRISVCALMCILKLDPEVGNCSGNGLNQFCSTGAHTTNWVITCSHIYNRNLVCGDGTSLDYCNVISITGELDMTIITLGRLYFVLFCRLAPTNVAAVRHGQRAAVRPHAFDQVTHSSGVGSEVIWAKVFSGLPV
jgi:hypothetical protein